MALPEGYSPWENLQNTIMKVQNKIVREEFSDVGDDNWDPDISTPRGELRQECTIAEEDTATMVKLRLDLFYIIMRRASGYHPPIYGIPSMEFFNNFSHFPQIILHFEEDKYEASVANRLPATAQISVRWVEDTYTRTEINALALKIKNDFCKPVVKWKKGRELFTYTDKKKGYYFQVYSYDELNAKKIIEKAFRLQHNVEPEWDDFLRDHKDRKNYTLQESQMILGDLKKKPKRRPIADVSFTYAELSVPGLLEPIILCDRTGTRYGAIELA
jgi:hypothetical protein